MATESVNAAAGLSGGKPSDEANAVKAILLDRLDHMPPVVVRELALDALLLLRRWAYDRGVVLHKAGVDSRDEYQDFLKRYDVRSAVVTPGVNVRAEELPPDAV